MVGRPERNILMAEPVITQPVTTPAPVTTPVQDPNPDIEYWKGEAKKAFGARDVERKERETLAARLNEIEAAKKQADENTQRTKLEEAGKYQEALKLQEQKFAEKYGKVTQTIGSRLVPMAIQNAAAKIENLTKEAIDDLPSMLRDRLAVNPETLEVFVVGPDNKQLVDEKLQPVSVASYIEGFVKSRPYLLVSSMPNRHNATGDKGKPTLDEIKNDPNKMMEWAKADPNGLQEAIKANFSPAEIVKRAREQQGWKG
jgi:hypothetical protein